MRPAAEHANSSLAWPPERVRNVCILAHVDHGKTTCADNLVASNGIISRQSAGKVRYLDSRADEQERQITMKSSAISLRWIPAELQAEGAQAGFLINLIDSPGHVDFTSEVSTAARLADGAIVVVDVVEGVAAQTRTVLRQAWRDRVKTCLFLNKVDRLIVELELTPMEAYQRLLKIIEQVNSLSQMLISEEMMAAEGEEAKPSEGIDLSADVQMDFDEATEEAWRYSPDKGNVAFGSAGHGWAFRVDTFAALFAGKMGANPKQLQKVFWGDWIYNPKTKIAFRPRPGEKVKGKPMFVQFILEQLWKVYEASYKNVDVAYLQKMQAQIPTWEGLEIQDMQPGSATVRELFSRWLPFSRAVLQMVTKHLPSPPEAAEHRLPVLCPRWFAGVSEASASDTAQSLSKSDAQGPVVVYLAKFLAADLERKVLTGDDLRGDADVSFVGICRVFSGTLRPGSNVCVTGTDGPSTRRLSVCRLFRLMGRYLEEVVDAPSGSMVAVHLESAAAGEEGGSREDLGVEQYLTLSEEPDGPVFDAPYNNQAFAIVRVNVEPQSVVDLDTLARGLRLLHRADPSVAVEALASGENVIGCCGPEHLKRCITDLQTLYARDVPLRISKPLVAIRETISAGIEAERVNPKHSALWTPAWATHLIDASTDVSGSVLSGQQSYPDEGSSDEGEAEGEAEKQDGRMTMSKAGVMSVWTANRQACLRVSALAMPPDMLAWMDEFSLELENMCHKQQPSVAFAGQGSPSRGGTALEDCLEEVSRQFDEKLSTAGGGVSSRPGTLCGLSLRKGSRAALLDHSGSAWRLQATIAAGAADVAEELPEGAEPVPAGLRPSVLAGFQMAACNGPLSEEPMRGVIFVVHGCHLVSDDNSGSQPIPYGPMSGQVMSAMKEACRYCIFRRGYARICEALLSLEVQCEQEMLGKVYSVLDKRRAKIMDEGLREGTSLFYINSFLPLSESDSLGPELRQAASGQVTFTCAFSHWELSEDDPYAESTLTAEELEDLGDAPLPPNCARKLIDAIRKRKGLTTDEKVVGVATKQRVLTRMK